MPDVLPSIFSLVLDALGHDGAAGTMTLNRVLDDAGRILSPSALIDALRDPRSIAEHESTPLVRAVTKRNLAAVQRLLEISPTLAMDATPEGITPLMVALRYKDPSIALALLPASDLQATDSMFGENVLEQAILHRSTAAVTLLLPHLANGLGRTNGLTPLMLAAAQGPAGNVQVLMTVGDVNAQDEQGRTALMLAVDEAAVDNVRALLGNADPLLVDCNGHDVFQRFQALYARRDRTVMANDWACLDLLLLFAPDHPLASGLADRGGRQQLPLWHNPEEAMATRHRIRMAYERPLLEAALDDVGPDQKDLPSARGRARL